LEVLLDLSCELHVPVLLGEGDILWDTYFPGTA
jgi:hypothetical protein